MLKLNIALIAMVLLVAVVFGALVTPEPITPNVVRLTWQTQPDTTWINVRDVTFDSVGIARSVTGGITNTVTISGTTGMVFQIQEYKLVGCCLELITFFNTNAVPYVDFPTATVTPTSTQTQTPQPINTAVPTPMIPPANYEPRLYMGVIHA